MWDLKKGPLFRELPTKPKALNTKTLNPKLLGKPPGDVKTSESSRTCPVLPEQGAEKGWG